MSSNTLQFDLTARREKNLRVLKTVDENIIEILEDYAHVAVYQFEVDSRKWERLDVEGTLFITRSLSDPFYSLIVLNKKGPSDFALDILNVLKISLQRPYLMLRCSTASAPITFGIWSHSETELDALYAIIVRIALNKESPVAPPSPQQVKATQLLSMLKPRSVITSASAASPKSPTPSMSSNSSTLATQMSFSPEGTQASSTSSKQNGSSVKSAALMSLLKPNSNGETESVAAVQSSVASMAVADSSSGVSKSMQLLSIMKQVSQTPAPKTTNSNNNTTTATNGTPEAKSGSAKAEPKSNGLNHIKVHKPSAPAASATNTTNTNTTNTASAKPMASSLEEDKRAELMMKLIKPRNTTVDDLLTDVDIAAKVKAATSAPAPSTTTAAVVSVSANTSSATTPSSESVRSTGTVEESAAPFSASSSKQDLLKNLLLSSKKPSPAPSSTTSPAPALPLPLPSPVTKSPAPQPVPLLPFGSPVGFQPIPSPSPAATRSSASPVTVTETATQRNADLLAAALRHSAQNIRALQAARSPTASPVLKGLSPPTYVGSGLQAPVAWASLSNGNITQSATTVSAGIASTSSKGPSPMFNGAGGAAAPRAQPVLISPSDLRNIAAAQR